MTTKQKSKFTNRKVAGFFNDRKALDKIISDLIKKRDDIGNEINQYEEIAYHLDEVTDVVDNTLFNINDGNHYDRVLENVTSCIRVENMPWEGSASTPDYIAFLIPIDNTLIPNYNKRPKNFSKLPNLEQLKRLYGDGTFTLFLYDARKFKSAIARSVNAYRVDFIANWKKRNAITISEPKSFDEAMKIAIDYASKGKLPKGVGGPKPRKSPTKPKAKPRAKSEPMTQTERVTGKTGAARRASTIK